MSHYKVESDDYGRVCPYCKTIVTPDDEEFSQFSAITSCDRCGKKFHVYEEIIMRYYSTPDCEVNGEKHDYEVYKDTGGKIHNVCVVCNKVAAVISSVSHTDLGVA